LPTQLRPGIILPSIGADAWLDVVINRSDDVACDVVLGQGVKELLKQVLG